MRVLITGAAGQDGSILAERLLAQGDEVFGVFRRRSDGSFGLAADAVKAGLVPLAGDLTDAASVRKCVREARPERVFHYGAMSDVGRSFEEPEHCFNVNVNGTLHVLEAVRTITPKARVYVAGTAEQYGRSPPPHTLDSIQAPASPYGVSKMAACSLARVYREGYGLHVVIGILANHESSRRGPAFLTRKVATYVARFFAGLEQGPLVLGTLEPRKDWGYAPEYVEATRLMLDAAEPRDFVVCTGELHSVRDFVEAAFGEVGCADWERYVRVQPTTGRPLETVPFQGDPGSVKYELGWEAKTRFADLVKLMVRAEVDALKNRQA